MSMNPAISFPYKVPFYDVDSYRVVWHGNYPQYFETSRCELLEKLGCPYRVMEEQGFFFPVVDMRIKYLEPLLFGQEVEIHAELNEWEHRLKIKYWIVDKETQRTVTKAHTIQMAVKMPEKISQYVMPDFFAQRLKAGIKAWV